jgi:hypothetical protein
MGINRDNLPHRWNRSGSWSALYHRDSDDHSELTNINISNWTAYNILYMFNDTTFYNIYGDDVTMIFIDQSVNIEDGIYIGSLYDQNNTCITVQIEYTEISTDKNLYKWFGAILIPGIIIITCYAIVFINETSKGGLTDEVKRY